MGKNKGKKKQQSQSEQSAPPAESRPGPSREPSQPPEQPKKGESSQQTKPPASSRVQPGPSGDSTGQGKKEHHVPFSQGTQPSSSEEASKPQQGGQRRKGKKGQPQDQPSQKQPTPQQEPGRKEGTQQQQQKPQQGPPGQSQVPAWTPQQPQQAGGRPGQQPIQQPQQSYAPTRGAQADVFPQQSWRQPQQPQQSQQQWGGPPPGYGGYQQVGPPPVAQPGRQASGPPQQQRGAGRGQPGQQPQPIPGYQDVHGPPPVSQPGRQASGPPQQQRGAGRGQPKQQQPQPIRGQPSKPSVEAISSAVSQLEVTKRADTGDANLVSKTHVKPGIKGRIIKVESNHLQLNLGSIKIAYHYDVNIEPDKPKKYMRPVVDSFIRKYFKGRYPAFDGKKNLYTAKPLTENLNDFFEDEVNITEEDGREKTFKVEIKFANKVDLTPLQNFLNSPVTPQEALQVVDIVLRMAPVVSCFPVGRSFFVKPDQIIDLGQGMEMYHGFYQSAIRGWKPLLNVDVAHKAFPKNINVVDALVDLLSTGRQEFNRDNLRTLDRFQEETLNKFVDGLRISYQIQGHPETRKGYRVNGIGQNAQRATFMHENKEITIVDYFSRYKNYRIRYSSLPTLWVGNKDRKDKILLPMELCHICEGQALNRKMTDLQTSKMIRYAATDNPTRKNKIMQGIRRANFNDNLCVREFGFSVGSEFQRLDARVLNPPNLQYARNKVVRVSRGVWRNDSFLNGATINKWTFVSACRYPPRPDEYKRMAEMFERSARDCGMTFASKATEPYASIQGRQVYADVEQYFKSVKGKFDVIFVVVPESGPQYSFVKTAAEIAVGCLTQCIKSNTVGRKMNVQTALNILLKVNSKLNGINHTLSSDSKPNILKKPVMIMGADVTHPGPQAKNIPSVAAVTASHDPKAFQYNITWRLQNPKVEIIEDLEAIVIEHLKFFYSKTKMKPEAIVFFRDGVSEGQFEQVKLAEIRAIRSACKKIQKEGFEPKITFLVVQKRHHTRLFPMDSRDSEDRNFNVPAGTCVDKDITHPFMQDFYLVSHASIQGVAKPTKYVTLWDDNYMDNDQVEELAYYLCHMFSRCNRSVSYPAPTYYAHLAAARAKVYIENDNLDMSSLQQEFNKYQIKQEIQKDLPMFFV